MALIHTDFFSEALGMCTQMDVILPGSDAGQPGKARKAWPVLFLLHGMSDDHTIWQRYTSIERYAAEKGLAVVMPTTRLGWYTDMHIGFDYWTYITEELPKIVHAFFPRISTRREDTFVAGLSMGGYGALKCGLRASHIFSHAAALSAATDICAFFGDMSLGAKESFWTDIFGPKEQVRGSFNDLFAAAESLRAQDAPKTRLYMWCGTEDFLYKQNLAMRDHLNALGLDLTYEESPGNHGWKYWDEKIQSEINWLPIGKDVK